MYIYIFAIIKRHLLDLYNNTTENKSKTEQKQKKNNK